MDKIDSDINKIQQENKIIKQLEEMGFYVSRPQISTCKICKEKKDLRGGVCFKCSDFVSGYTNEDGTHTLWDVRNSSNKWVSKI